MLVKSLIIFSVLFSILGLNPLSASFDGAIYKVESGQNNLVKADINLYDLPNIYQRPKIISKAQKTNISAHRFLLADMDSNSIILKQNYKQKVPIASTTKIMTAVVALENFKEDEILTISSESAFQTGADSYLRVGEKISVVEISYCLLLKSGNDAAYALAEHYNKNYGGDDDFVSIMNRKAKQLGMNDTEYMDPAGLDTTGYSTAYDLYLITKYALKNETFSKIVSTRSHDSISKDRKYVHRLENSNRLVGDYQYPGAIGVKTGYMPEAGHCLVSAAKRDEHTLIGVILYTFRDTVTASADESKKLLDWGFNNLVW